MGDITEDARNNLMLGTMGTNREALPSYGSQIENEAQRFARGASNVRGLAVTVKSKLIGQPTPSEGKDERETAKQVAREGFLTNHLDTLHQSNSELELAVTVLEEVLESLQ